MVSVLFSLSFFLSPPRTLRITLGPILPRFPRVQQPRQVELTWPVTMGQLLFREKRRRVQLSVSRHCRSETQNRMVSYWSSSSFYSGMCWRLCWEGRKNGSGSGARDSFTIRSWFEYEPEEKEFSSNPSGDGKLCDALETAANIPPARGYSIDVKTILLAINAYSDRNEAFYTELTSTKVAGDTTVACKSVRESLWTTRLSTGGGIRELGIMAEYPQLLRQTRERESSWGFSKHGLECFI